MFGPAYKGIPLATSVSGALARNYGIDKPFFFNRKEAKDHGEGGSIVGYKPQDGDRVIIIEDVITAGTAIRETMPVLKSCGGRQGNRYVHLGQPLRDRPERRQDRCHGGR